MRENVSRHLLNVVRRRVISPGQKRGSLSGSKQHQRPSRADSEFQSFVGSRLRDQFDDVLPDNPVDVNLSHSGLHADNLVATQHWFYRVNRVSDRLIKQNMKFCFGVGIAEIHVDKESIQLSFGQRIRAMKVNGILRGHNNKWIRQLVTDTFDRRLRFTHRFQQGRLSSR